MWSADFRHPIEVVRVVAEYTRRASARDPTQRDFPHSPELAVAVWPPTKEEWQNYFHAEDEHRAADEAMDARLNAREATKQSALIRDIFGITFSSVNFSAEWRTDTALALARQMYESRDFSAMPILADALQDAGCDSADILNHCRGPGPHVRGCWVVDLVLGKE